MEIAIGVVIGVILGGVAAWFAAKARTSADVSALRSEAELARERFADSENDAAQAREEASKWQKHSTENEKEIATLEERVAGFERGKTEFDQAIAELRAEAKSWQDKASENGSRAASLQVQLGEAKKQLAERTDIEKTLLDQFKVMASDVVSNNSESFLSAANEKVGSIVKPLSDELKRIETARNESQGSLKQQIETLVDSNNSLENETRNLAQSLKTSSSARGRWGEIQLRRVAELAGMIDHCDFQEQVSIPGENGTSDRPDMIVYMPSERTIVVDAKTPLNAYMDSIKADSPKKRDEALSKHAAQVRERASSLTQKAYWKRLERTPEFVVMFLPGEFFLQPALERDPGLFERTMKNGVVIATPNTLMALLKTVEMGWREAKIAQEARKIADVGRELHDRLTTYSKHISNLGGSLRSAVDNYNKGVGSFDSRVSVSARKLMELGVTDSSDISEMKPIDEPLRHSKAELAAASNGAAKRRRAPKTRSGG